MVFERSLLALLFVCANKAVTAQSSNFSLYAYGTDITPGIRLFFGDSLAYVGHSAPTFVKEAVNVTMSHITTDNQFLATPDGTLAGVTQPALYIDTTEGANNPVGFASTDDMPTGGNDTGFGLYGGWAYHLDNDGTIAMNFLASPTNETGIYLVKWKTSGATKASSEVAISLRTVSPVAETL
ncbi:hypothetical protein K504DRAFT_523069 [Pleomassaria siparia CBS 279.74]|uniref:Uncharacterized protein n=1 Tax=Pleomassaria siparia CBS 279.74 TaxID=1314801 RepID=A0A6G1KH02_9PLEO|nr:hypothetical protein K504DRAFT_523069 [Pleomassaria siparia CBS 279.74]